MFSNFITNVLEFQSMRIDPDVYIRKATKDSGQQYYEILLVYVDDVLVVSHDTGAVMRAIGKEFEIKDGKWGPPEFYLGAGVEKNTIKGEQYWSMRSDKYVKNAVQTVRDLLKERWTRIEGR